MIPLTSTRGRGFTLLEVLVALVIISIGALGVAAMQASALSNTHASQTESVVAIEARSLADAMEANPVYWKSGTFAPSIAVASSTLTDNGTLEPLSVDCTQGICTAQQMAAYDLKHWGTDLDTQAPGATGQITCQIGAPVICTIVVTWQPRTAVAVNQGTQSTATTPPASLTYTLVNQL
jgi:type IV pilus assembly protein PilV